MPGIFFLSPQSVIIDPNQQTVHNNATITASGSAVYSGFGSKEVNYIINIKNSPTGTTPTITFTIQEVDPVDQTTVTGSLATSGSLNSIGTSTLILTNCITGTVKITWTVTGTTPSFTGVNTTLLQKNAGGTVTANAGTGNFNVIGTGTAGTAATGVITVQGIAGGVTIPVSGTVTANQGGAPWSENITQFGGTNISTGTGVSGAGIPRVTIAND